MEGTVSAAAVGGAACESTDERTAEMGGDTGGGGLTLIEIIIADPMGALLVLLIIFMTSLAAGYNGAELSVERRARAARSDRSVRTGGDAAAADEATADEGGDSLEPAHPGHFVCSITAELMRDPVMAYDGHSYERAAIERWFATR